MVAVKAHQADNYLSKPDPKIRGYLFFGSDPGLVQERSRELANRLAKQSKPESEILRIDEQDLDANPDHIAIELQTMPMFGGGKVLRVEHNKRLSASDLKNLIAEASEGCAIIIAAGNLKPTDKIRSLFEKSNHAAAIGCYTDTQRDLESVISKALQQSHQTITMDARELLLERLGADRALSIGELEKLTLYTAGKAQITIDDIDAIVGDASELALDGIINAAALGQAKSALHETSRALSSGQSVHAILAATTRHFHRLEATRALLDSGTNEADCLKRLKPPVHFKQKGAFSTQLHSWRHDYILQALRLSADATKMTRTSQGMETQIIERLLIRIAQLAQLSKRRVSTYQ